MKRNFQFGVCLSILFLFLFTGRSFAVWGKIAADVRVTSDVSDSEYPDLAKANAGYGIVWVDFRHDQDGICDVLAGTFDCNYEIYLAILDAMGNKIGSDIRITDDPAISASPSIVWTGTEYGISWADYRDDLDDICSISSGTFDCNFEIYFVRVDEFGNKIGSDTRITFDASYSHMASLVWSGGGYGLTWRDDRDGYSEIYFAGLDPAGNKIVADSRITDSAPSLLGNWLPDIVWTGTEYGIAWQDTRDSNWEIYFARVDTSGNKKDTDVRITDDPGNSTYARLAWADGEYGLCWTDDRSGSSEAYFAGIDASGNKIGLDKIISDAGSSAVCNSLVWTGAEYGLSWEDDRDGNAEIYFARLSPSGDKLDADVRITNDPGSSTGSSLVWSGPGLYAVSWMDDREGNTEIYFARIADFNVFVPALSEWGLALAAAILFAALIWRTRRYDKLAS